jgi:hypothetical protein
MAHRQLTQPKRGYLANILIIPPLIYPFQYNPKEVVDEKKLEWKTKVPLYKTRGLEGFATGVQADLAAFRSTTGAPIGKGTEFFKRLGSGYGKTLGTATEVLGRTFSAGELKQFDKENPRTLSFKFTIDGREHRAGEPERRRNDKGDILADLAMIRSFAYPQFASDLELLGAFGTASPTIKGNEEITLANLWFNHPPTMTLVLGDLSCEGFLEEMKITVSQFNEDLNPVHAEVEIKMTEKIDTLSFALDSVKRLGRMAYHSSYTDIPRVLGF